VDNFHNVGLPLPLRQALDKNNLSVPTPIQAQAIPLALQGKDILGSAQTGTGKTLAFAIPLVAKLLEKSKTELALVIVPTRELAQQVINEIKKLLCRNSSLKVALLIGGESISKQLTQLSKRPQIIIGTPGRITDHIKRKALITQNINTLVLDETDLMLDMGFGIQIEEIVKHLPKTRQTLMFSATLPSNIVKLAGRYLNNPERVSVESKTVTSAKIKQEIIYASEPEKYSKLVEQLCQREGSIIIFVKTKRGADQLASELHKDDYSALAIHGDLRQHKRDRVINSFRRGNNQIMVATDVASRGLDIPHIQHVINYDAPQSQADYIHRIGRTARAGAEGFALSFITPQDKRKLPALTSKEGELNFDSKVPFKKPEGRKVHKTLSMLKKIKNSKKRGGLSKKKKGKAFNAFSITPSYSLV
jgi:superfamily II DNA/RNA helicase